ncbi:MAG: hypothetical protein A2Y25_02975 [Candidatus Melainabacteria bacterium GWF2_37_15]|nr:MAG: hypothetical protein A2Y25_02975 [Candidatus Melainabacteria bacterium GWF2_37_15]
MAENLQHQRSLRRERYKLLIELDRLMDKPLAILAFVWLVLIMLDLTLGLNPQLLMLSYIIWGIFIVDFLLGYIIAPYRIKYLKRNWITGLSVLLPAFGVLRLFRAGRFILVSRFLRPLNTLKLLTSTRRSAKAIRQILKTNALGNILVFTIILIFAGAAGLLYFERDVAQGLNSYWDALWWTSMIITTIGTDYWPLSWEGRVLAFLLALYAFTFFGYLTANLATYFIKSK